MYFLYRGQIKDWIPPTSNSKFCRCFAYTVFSILLWKVIPFLYPLKSKCITSQNGLTHFKNLAAFALRFLKCVWPFWDVTYLAYRGYRKGTLTWNGLKKVSSSYNHQQKSRVAVLWHNCKNTVLAKPNLSNKKEHKNMLSHFRRLSLNFVQYKNMNTQPKWMIHKKFVSRHTLPKVHLI